MKKGFINLYLASFLFLLLVACGGGGTESKIPAIPSNVTATPGPGYITVTWKDNSDDETGFIIYRDDGSSASLNTQAATKLKEVEANTTEFIDTDIELAKNHRYSVVAKGEEGNSEQPPLSEAAKVVQGVDLMVGTLNRHPFEDSFGTAFGVYFFFSRTSLVEGDLIITIKGPVGWNEDEPLVITPEQELLTEIVSEGWWTFSSYFRDAIAGEYSLTVKAKEKSYTAKAQLTDASYRFTPPSTITITESTSERVVANWTAPLGIVSYATSIWEGRYEAYAGVAGVTTDITTTFEALTLVPGSYVFEVATFPVDISSYPIKMSPYGVAFDFKSFEIPFPEGTFYKVDSMGAYLPRDSDDLANPATAISLSSLSVSAGDCLNIVRTGAYSARVVNNRPDNSTVMIGVFHNPTGYVAAGTKGTQEDIVSEQTPSGLDTDIPEDFRVGNLFTVEVPAGVTELLFSPDDSFHSDNGDPNNDYGVSIAKVSCP